MQQQEGRRWELMQRVVGESSGRIDVGSSKELMQRVVGESSGRINLGSSNLFREAKLIFGSSKSGGGGK